MPKSKKMVMLRHLYGYSDIMNTDFNSAFQFYQVIGCRNNPCCITPCSKKDEDVPYYRPYSESHETRLYFRGFSIQELRAYLSCFREDDACSKCTHASVRRLVACHRF